jgi:S1-C subfamily serine protease
MEKAPVMMTFSQFSPHPAIRLRFHRSLNRVKILLSALLLLTANIAYAASNPYDAEAAIYKVEVSAPNSNQVGIGTGVLVAQDKILTNCHVITNHPGWPQVVHRQSGRRFYVTSHYKLGNNDACILVGGFIGTPVRLTVDFQEGQSVWIFGFPSGLPSVVQGSIKGVVDTDRGKSVLLNAFCAPGSSGGPVINIKGELVGLNWGVFRYQNQCLAIPATILYSYLNAS